MREKVENFFLWKAFLKLERFVMVLASIAIVLTIVINVVCRYIFHVTFNGYDEIVVILALWLYYVGGLYGSYEDCQIKADVVSVMVTRESTKRLLNIIQKIFTLVISIILAVWAFEYLQFASILEAARPFCTYRCSCRALRSCSVTSRLSFITSTI